MKFKLIGISIIAAITAILWLASERQWRAARDVARQEFISSSKAMAQQEMVVVERAYLESKSVVLADRVRQDNRLTLVILALGTAATLLLTQTNLEKSRALARSMAAAKDLAQKSEAEALRTAAELRVLNEDVTRLNVALSDKINQLNDAQEDLVNKGKMAQLGQLVATVAHEVRNPLGTIRTASFLLQRKLGDQPQDISNQLRRIEDGVERCDSIISKLLDYSRSQDRLEEILAVDSWLEDYLSRDLPEVPEDIAIVCNLGLAGDAARFDPQRLRQALSNLILNAVHAIARAGSGRRQGTIAISTARTARGIEIAVQDNGPGMPKEVLTRVREPLFTTKSFGAGLGVPAAQKIAEQHGGGLDIASEPGRGACFTIWLPAAQDMRKRA